MDYIHKLEECDCCRQVEVLEQIHNRVRLQELEQQQILYSSQVSTLQLVNNQLSIRVDRLSCGG